MFSYFYTAINAFSTKNVIVLKEGSSICNTASSWKVRKELLNVSNFFNFFLSELMFWNSNQLNSTAQKATDIYTTIWGNFHCLAQAFVLPKNGSFGQIETTATFKSLKYRNGFAGFYIVFVCCFLLVIIRTSNILIEMETRRISVWTFQGFKNFEYWFNTKFSGLYIHIQKELLFKNI